ncbi:MAG: Na+/H+ antiporter NhaC [Lachnospiraceae bacterium]|nr:Na+/H+ antiporter NhaC [Lachnospiraceae bacterium]
MGTQSNEKKAKRELGKFETFFPIIAMLAIVIIGKGFLSFNITAMLVLAASVLGCFAVYCGISWNEMFGEIAAKIQKSLGAILLLIIVGGLVGAWMSCGTIPMLIYYGVQIISPQWLLVTSFLLTAIVSVCTGSSWSSASTIGIALMGIATGLGANLPAVAGAVVAGAFFGDKMSPLSDTTNLAPIAAGSELYSHIRHMFWTTGPATVISLVVYAAVGLSSGSGSSASSEVVTQMIAQLDSMYNWNLLLLLPLIIILAGSVLRKPSLPVMVLSAGVAIVEAKIFQGISFSNLFSAFVTGFSTNMITKAGFDNEAVIPEIAKLLNRGGMESMMSTVAVLLAALAMAGILTSIGSLDKLLELIVSRAKTTGSLILSTIATGWIMAMTTSNSHVSILITGELFQEAYKKRGLAPVNLSRSLEDSVTLAMPCIPWASSAIYMTTCTGIPTQQYLPWAILCWMCSILAIIYGFTGIGIKKAGGNDEI